MFENALNVLQGTIDAITSGGILQHPVIAKFAFFGKLIFYFAVFVFGFAAIYKYILKYNKLILVRVTSGGKVVDLKKDRGMEVVDKDGKHKLRLQKLRMTAPMPELSLKQKMGKKDLYEFTLDDKSGELMPIELDIKRVEKEGAEPIEKAILKVKKINLQELKAWRMFEDEKLVERRTKKSQLEKWIPTILVSMAIIVSFMIMFFMFKEIGGGMANIGGSLEKVASACLGR